MTNTTNELTWSHKVTAGALEIWTSSDPTVHATIEKYDRLTSHWNVLQTAVYEHGRRAPVLQLTGPEAVSERSCSGVFVISHPGRFTIAASSTDIGEGGSALVQIYRAGNEWQDTEYEDMLSLSSNSLQSLLATDG